MSGGSWDYLYSRVEDAADRLKQSKNGKRVAFAVLLADVADALHDIEWVDSCDMSPGDEIPAIDTCLNFEPDDAIRAYVEETIEELRRLVK